MRVSWSIRRVACVLAAGIAGAGTCIGPALPVAATPAHAVTCGSWTASDPPDTGNFESLHAVTVLSPGNAWAVGAQGGTPHGDPVLIEHWANGSWQQVNGAETTQIQNLFGVTATSPGNVWAVGFYYTAAGPMATLAEHWDGSSWTQATTPSPGTLGSISAA